MRILVVTPTPPRARTGNGVTAARWASLLRSLGHGVVVAGGYHGQHCDVLIALHARKSFASVTRFRRERPEGPLVVARTGTDLYGDLRRPGKARRSLVLASRLVVLQPLGLRAVPAALRGKTRAILQSARRAPGRTRKRSDVFEVCQLAHLRAVKDPFRAARAVRRLPAASRIHVLHLGAALDAGTDRRARDEEAANPRYHWLGSRPRAAALRILARSRLLVLTSRLEGGANAVSEALASSVPVVSSRVAGSVGILGRGYPGYFPAGNTRALARLLRRAEADAAFYRRLQRWCDGLKPLVAPARERQEWRLLLRELGATRAGPPWY